MEQRYWLGIGANLGDREGNLRELLAALRAAGVDIEAVSSLYESAPREIEDQPAFLNALTSRAPLLGLAAESVTDTV